MQHFAVAHLYSKVGGGSPQFTPAPFAALPASYPQQDPTTSTIPPAHLQFIPSQEQSQHSQRQQPQTRRYLAHRPSDSAIASTFSRASYATLYRNAMQGSVGEVGAVDHNLGLLNGFMPPWADFTGMGGVTYPQSMPMRSTSPASSVSSYTGSVGSNMTGS